MSVKCLYCGHRWERRKDKPSIPQCPKCRRHHIADGEKFEWVVVQIIKMMRQFPEDPLEGMARIMDRSHHLVATIFPGVNLTSQAAFLVLSEALTRLGVRKDEK